MLSLPYFFFYTCKIRFYFQENVCFSSDVSNYSFVHDKRVKDFEMRPTASRATSNGVPLDRLHGTAFLDMSRDAQITALPSFEKALQAIISVPDFVTRFGAQEARRAVLQFVYQYFTRADNIRYEEAAFESLWEDFTAEVQDPRWVTRGLANVRNFASNSFHLDLGDGIVIKGRNFDDLASLGKL